MVGEGQETVEVSELQDDTVGQGGRERRLQTLRSGMGAERRGDPEVLPRMP